MATKRYGVAELVQLITKLSEPVAGAWRAEDGPSWWGRVRSRAANWLRLAADRIAPTAVTAAVTLAVELPAPVQTPTPELVPAAKPARKPAKPRKPATATATPRPGAKPAAAAARVTRPKPSAKVKPATTRQATGRKRAAK